MTTQVYDPVTRTFKVKEEPKAVAAEVAYINLDALLLAKLAGFAKADGFDLTGATDQAKKGKVNKAVRIFVEQAIQDFITAREAK